MFVSRVGRLASRIAPLFVALLLFAGFSPARADDASLPLTVTFLDIGQGDSTLIETPDGHTILIDGGEGQLPDAGELYPYDAGRRVILPVLRKKGIHTLDVVIATHPHSDHIGGLLDVLADPDLTVRELWDNGTNTWEYPAYQKLREIVQQRKISLVNPKESQVYPWGKDVSATVIHINPQAKGVNDTSIVVRMVYGEVSFLFSGDAEREAETSMVTKHAGEIASTVLKVGHHGSRTSSTSAYLKAVHPKFGVISCGCYNGYGHPHPETLKAFEKAGVELHRTDLESHIEMRTDGHGIAIRTAERDKLDLPRAGFEAPQVTASAIKENVGRWVTLKGKVTGVAMVGRKKDNYLLTIDDAAKVFIPKGIDNALQGEGISLVDVLNRRVELSGGVRDGSYGLQVVVASRRLFRYAE